MNIKLKVPQKNPQRDNLRGCGHRQGHFFAWFTDNGSEFLNGQLTQNNLSQCHRCRGWWPVSEYTFNDAYHKMPHVLSGAEMRQRFWLRFFAVERFFRAGLLFAVAWILARFHRDQLSLQQAFHLDWPLIDNVAKQMHINLDASAFVEHLRSGLFIAPGKLNLAITLVLVYACVEVIEGVGLASGKRWGEYVAAAVTSAFIPLEIWELVDKFSVLKGIFLVLNVGLVVYLVYAKRLFGLRGGEAGLKAALRKSSLLETVLARMPAPVARPATD